MSLRDVCDTVYVLHVERLERQVLADRQCAMAAIIAGDDKTELPSFVEAQQELDAKLAAEPFESKLRALGVA